MSNRKTKVKGNSTVHPRTDHEGLEGEQRYSSTLSLTSALDGGLVVNTMPQLLYSEERPCTRRTGGWVDARGGLGVCRESRTSPGYPGPSRP